MKAKRYTLKDGSKDTITLSGAPVYLQSLRLNGTRSVWTKVKGEARQFTMWQRLRFSRTHPHVRGRWVLA